MEYLKLYEKFVTDVPFDGAGKNGSLCISKDGKWLMDPINMSVKSIDDFVLKYDVSSGYLQMGLGTQHKQYLYKLQDKYKKLFEQEQVDGDDLPILRFLRTFNIVGKSNMGLESLSQIGLTPLDFTFIEVMVGVMKINNLNI